MHRATHFPPAALLAILLALVAAPAAAGGAAGTITVVESVPVETMLDLPGLPNAPDVWLEMIRGAATSIDVCTFYFSDDPERDDALDAVLAALAEAAGRGVRVRALSDKGFHRTYPEIVDRLGALPGAESRLLDARAAWGGVQHSKYMIVDGREFFVGSQNWDWRALEHIHELGARVDHPALAASLQAIFDLDWALAAGETPAPAAPVAAGPFPLICAAGDTAFVRLAASPPEALPAGLPHDEPLLVELIDGARDTVRLQLLSYNPSDRENRYWPTLENALRRAAVRGVQVRVILSNWSKRSYMLPFIQSLAVLPNVEIRFTNIPEWSGGFVPFARVEHAKYLVADRDRAWIGTSNWARDYFHESRNISLFCEGRGVAADLIAFFETSWSSPYAETVDPCGSYAPPRRE